MTAAAPYTRLLIGCVPELYTQTIRATVKMNTYMSRKLRKLVTRIYFSFFSCFWSGDLFRFNKHTKAPNLSSTMNTQGELWCVYENEKQQLARMHLSCHMIP